MGFDFRMSVVVLLFRVICVRKLFILYSVFLIGLWKFIIVLVFIVIIKMCVFWVFLVRI